MTRVLVGDYDEIVNKISYLTELVETIVPDGPWMPIQEFCARHPRVTPHMIRHAKRHDLAAFEKCFSQHKRGGKVYLDQGATLNYFAERGKV